jgi:hypothetical protein
MNYETETIFTIRALKNGCILQAHIKDQGEVNEYVYQEFDDDEADFAAFATFLNTLIQDYGPDLGSRYAAHRLYVTVHPGDKHPNFTNELFDWPDQDDQRLNELASFFKEKDQETQWNAEELVEEVRHLRKLIRHFRTEGLIKEEG